MIPFFVVNVTIFNTFDFIGRSLPRWDSLVIVSPRWLWLPVVLRAAFVPLFVICKKPQLIHNDLATFAIMAAFALTNGYLGTLAMMFGPAKLAPADKETGGSIMVFMLTVGLTAGVWAGKALNEFLPGFET